MATVLAPARPTVPRLWPGATVVCLGTGPSLTPDDVLYVQGKARVIAVNDAVRLAPWADVLYACDFKWWHWHAGMPTFGGMRFALTPHAARYPGVTVLKNTGETGLEREPHGLKTGKNSGYQAINLAMHLGASRVVLLGYDMTPKGRNGGHFFGAHPDQSLPPFGLCLQHFKTLAPLLAEAGVEVINCSRQTALTAFPQQPLEAVL